MTKAPKITPMLQQYLEIKEQYQDAILFYRMGDFYEMFFEDAAVASKILGITLTSRNSKDATNKVPMCGIPYHAASGYLAKLVKAGRRVAICEQTENPSEAKGIVRREVVRVVSPGVVVDSGILDDKDNLYVAAICCKGKGNDTLYGISFLDLSTGAFLLGEFLDTTNNGESILDQLTRMTPAELLVNENDLDLIGGLVDTATTLLPGLCVTQRPATQFHFSSCEELLIEHFKVNNLAGFGCNTLKQGVIAAGVLLDYVIETQKSDISHIEKLTPIDLELILQIDDSSRRNLELTQTIIGSQREGSLLSVLDHSCTPMGARMLKQEILFPLQNVERINARLGAVRFLYGHTAIRNTFRELLTTIYDVERLNSRMVLGNGNGRDMLALKQSLAKLPAIRELLLQCDAEHIRKIGEDLDVLADLHQLLENTIHEEAPITLREGRLIKEGYNEELDELMHIQRHGRQLILDLESQERNATGIAKLKVGFNKVFGYFIEVSRLQSANVPDTYIRKQTLVNAERFITPELKEFETKVLGAQDRRLELEYQLFVEIRSQLASESSRLLKSGALLAKTDFLVCLAEVAHLYRYKCPEVNNGDSIDIIEGRHPVIERSLPNGKFVPNDVHLDQETEEVLIITGPNMAGKSTILRQTALIVLMAQMGSFVPAKEASIGVVDRIFTRVGAMDDLRRGQSTFMVEMNETANILNNATEKSLVILDEIGRGTSTFDGLSIAWAVAEDLVQKNNKGVKTLFATHYHELTDLARTEERVRNYSIAVREWNDTIIFLHKLVKGGTNRSYGIQVAGLAGVPERVVRRAGEILKNIEQGEFNHDGTPSIAKSSNPRKPRGKKHPNQLSLFPPAQQDPLRTLLQNISVDDLSPRQALDLIYELMKHLK
ncbi:DNA mismatch repair protein MutS [Desulfocapsa sulfexigens DSM 10523]|uniref:DNA mismatch repair protein MutS n=1 Tax=Desulfocapsa sulfexigens (strain DSM 10523 / SB164P1) TaxID=1167006 RepID=M1NF00_DESSD|nr:DNA mismatch repair protein MutS [Desulfocapsa sulfexigens]AGF78269.1 DNA mismatch repair protein MutS [Desulfocapsa sulfexigens DSM 10523]